jgi:copper(I)-binding protein
MKRLAWTLLSLLFAVLSACRNAEDNGLRVQSVWGRPSPQGASNAAFYMTMVNDGDQPDVLRSVSAGTCGTVELHRSFMDDEGIMRMAPVPGSEIIVPAGERVVLEPGGVHVMCIGLQQPLLMGREVPLTLEFDVAGTMVVGAEIRQDEP